MNDYKEVKNDVVWYYCNHKVFENIISNHELWLTDITQSNDSNEIYKALSLFETMLCDSITSSFNYMDKAAIESLTSFCKKCIKNTKTSCVWFAMCFSEKGNSLPQWRAYGEGGKGYSIGFHTDKIKSLINSYKTALRQIRFAKVRYVSSIQVNYNYKNTSVQIVDEREKLIQTSIAGLCTKLQTFNGGFINKTGALPRNIKKEIKGFINNMILSIAFFKDDDFESESEARICYARHININKLSKEELKKNKNSLMNSLYFTFKEGEIIPHIKLHIDEIQDLIKEIVIGPNNTATADMVKRFLIKGGSFKPKDKWTVEGITVSKSAISCR